MSLRFRILTSVFLLILTGVSSVYAQQTKTTLTVKDKPKESKEKPKKEDKQTTALANANAEQVAESVIFIYSNLRGRDGLSQIRKTTIERGQLSITDANGKTDNAKYELRIMRGEKLDKEKIRLDQEFPSAKYALVYSDDKVFGIFNNAVFQPREDAAKLFQNNIWHSTDALLRYKENESKLELGERRKISGVDFFVIKLTDRQNRLTTYYISSKTLHVMMLEYEEEGIKYRRKFYDFNVAQGTLVPYRTVLWANDKQVEEIEIGTVTYGQKVENDMFSAN